LLRNKKEIQPLEQWFSILGWRPTKQKKQFGDSLSTKNSPPIYYNNTGFGDPKKSAFDPKVGIEKQYILE